MRNRIVRILPIVTTVAVMVMIFLFSAQNSDESSGVSGGLIKRVLNMLPFTMHIAAAQKEVITEHIHNMVRKCAHFTIYAALGFSAYAMFAANVKGKKRLVWWGMAVALCCFYAATDEFHQTFIPGRSGEIRDVLIDTCGGGTGAALMLMIKGIFAGIKNRREKS